LKTEFKVSDLAARTLQLSEQSNNSITRRKTFVGYRKLKSVLSEQSDIRGVH